MSALSLVGSIFTRLVSLNRPAPVKRTRAPRTPKTHSAPVTAKVMTVSGKPSKFGIQAAAQANGLANWGGARSAYAVQEQVEKIEDVQKRAQDLHWNSADIRGHHYGRTARVVGAGVDWKASVKPDEVGMSAEAAKAVCDRINRQRQLHSRNYGFDSEDKRRSEGFLQVMAFMTALALGACLIHRVIRMERGRIIPLALELIPGTRISTPFDRLASKTTHFGIEYSDQYRTRVVGYWVKKVPRTIGNNVIEYPEWDYIPREDGIMLEMIDLAGMVRSLPDTIAVTRLVFNRAEFVEAVIESMRNQSLKSVVYTMAPNVNPADFAEDNQTETPTQGTNDLLPTTWVTNGGIHERFVPAGTEVSMNTATIPAPDFRGFDEMVDSRITRGLNTRGSEFTRKVDSSYSGGMQERQIDAPIVEQAREVFTCAWNQVHFWTLDAMYLSGAVNIPNYTPETRMYWAEARVQFPGELPLNPIDHRNALAMGLTSEYHEAEKDGDDYESLVLERAKAYAFRRKVEDDNDLPEACLEPAKDLPEVANQYIEEERDGGPIEEDDDEDENDGGMDHFKAQRNKPSASARLKAVRV